MVVKWRHLSKRFLSLTSPRCCNSGRYPPRPPRRPCRPACPQPHCHGCWPCAPLSSTRCTRDRTAQPNRTGPPGSIRQLPKQNDTLRISSYFSSKHVASFYWWSLLCICHDAQHIKMWNNMKMFNIMQYCWNYTLFACLYTQKEKQNYGSDASGLFWLVSMVFLGRGRCDPGKRKMQRP